MSLNFSVVFFGVLFLYGIYLYNNSKDRVVLWIIFATIVFLFRELLEVFFKLPFLQNIEWSRSYIENSLLLIGLLLFGYAVFLSFKVVKLLNKDYPIIILTEDLSSDEVINLTEEHIWKQIQEKKIVLKNGAKLWITDGKADGLVRVYYKKDTWLAVNQKRTNRFVHPNWPFHSSKLDSGKEKE